MCVYETALAALVRAALLLGVIGVREGQCCRKYGYVRGRAGVVRPASLAAVHLHDRAQKCGNYTEPNSPACWAPPGLRVSLWTNGLEAPRW